MKVGAGYQDDTSFWNQRYIIKELKLRNPIYRRTACHGHFGRQEDGFEWEKTDKIEVLKKGVK